MYIHAVRPGVKPEVSIGGQSPRQVYEEPIEYLANEDMTKEKVSNSLFVFRKEYCARRMTYV